VSEDLRLNEDYVINIIGNEKESMVSTRKRKRNVSHLTKNCLLLSIYIICA
jgi:hypothetical protein